MLASRYSRALDEPIGHLRRAMLTASAIQSLRQALSKPVMAQIMALQGSPLGFLTDKDKDGGYKEDAVKDVVISALLMGLFPVNNEFNIISFKMYPALNGYKRLVRETPGLSNLEEFPGVPRLSDGRTLVRYGAKWKISGQVCELNDAEGKPGRVFSIKVNNGMGDDAVVGKARRKALKAIYETIHGSERTPDGDGDIDDAAAAGVARAAESAKPPTGRVKVERPAAQQPTETIADDGEVITHPPADESQEAPPAKSEAEQLALQDLLTDLSMRIEEAESAKALEAIGAEMLKHRTFMGEENYSGLLINYQEQGRQIASKKRG